MPGPLAGIRILDLTTVGFGPYGTQILGDYGAEVIKVESPEGDITRGITPFRNSGMGHFFLNANRNKRCIVLDLKQAQRRRGLPAPGRNHGRCDLLDPPRRRWPGSASATRIAPGPTRS